MWILCTSHGLDCALFYLLVFISYFWTGSCEKSSRISGTGTAGISGNEMARFRDLRIFYIAAQI